MFTFNLLLQHTLLQSAKNHNLTAYTVNREIAKQFNICDMFIVTKCRSDVISTVGQKICHDFYLNSMLKTFCYILAWTKKHKTTLIYWDEVPLINRAEKDHYLLNTSTNVCFIKKKENYDFFFVVKHWFIWKQKKVSYWVTSLRRELLKKVKNMIFFPFRKIYLIELYQIKS